MKSFTHKIFVLGTVLVLASLSFAVTPSNASLKGNYSFQLSSAHGNSWGKQLSCSGKSVWMGGNTVKNESIVGTITFNGAGKVTGSFTQYGHFNQTASNNTVSCSSGGHAVFDAATNGTLTGTYSLPSSGAGAMTITPSGSSAVGFVIKVAAGNASSGIRSTVFLTELNSDHSVDVTGSAELQ